MERKPKILAFTGSLRADSLNKKLLKIAIRGAEAAGAEVTYIDLQELPLPVYNGDIESKEGVPENAIKIKTLMQQHDGFLISSPEYNSSISAALKNCIDWASRSTRPNEPYLSCFTNKTAVIMSASPGALGGLRGLVQLRSILENINTLVLPLQKCISNASDAFDAEGNLKSSEQQHAIEELGRSLSLTIAKLN